jgi:Zn-finger protein
MDSQDSRAPSITTSDSGAPGSSGLSSLHYIPTHTKKRLRTSYIWSHTASNDRNEVIINDKGVSVWRCQYCNKDYVESGGTDIVKRHLRAHNILPEASSREVQRERIQENLKDAFARAGQLGDHKRRRLNSTISTESLDPAMLEQLYVQ